MSDGPLPECGTLSCHRPDGTVDVVPITAEHLMWAKRQILDLAPHISARRARPPGVDPAQDDADASMVRSMTGQILEACYDEPVRLWAFILASGQLAHCLGAFAVAVGLPETEAPELVAPWLADERP